MSNIVKSPDPEYPIEIDLKNRTLAAVWAWLWPGAGHLYQGRRAKGILFMVCILSTFVYGFGIGGWKVVFMRTKRPYPRLHYICQVCVGIPALPAVIEWKREAAGRPPLFGGLYRPPDETRGIVGDPPGVKATDELALWNEEYKALFDLGTLYTMVAGLLNLLAVYDAYAGPAFTSPEDESSTKKRRKKKLATAPTEGS
ncbi:MAG: hypothetical protein KDB27_02805 [Planctomycetales bacterium]|nr:hypothetical protein [Planctomycetales bacterium]